MDSTGVQLEKWGTVKSSANWIALKLVIVKAFPAVGRNNLEKLISNRFQFDMIKYDLVDLNQMGGVRQRSTKDAGLFLMHLVHTEWVKGYHTSVVAFDIAQSVLPFDKPPVPPGGPSEARFPPQGGHLLCVLSGAEADVGVGQGSALSPVLSALVVAPIMKLYRIKEVGLGTTLITFVNDAFIHALFTTAGLVLGHNKSEVFHFTRACTSADRPINLGFAPHTGATPLRPKTFWCYLGFYFDQRLTFVEHIWYYSTKALTTVMVMRMLGNSTRGLSPKNKHILYHHRYGLFHSELEIMPAEPEEAFADDPVALFNIGNICQHLQDTSSSLWLARIIKYLDQFGFSLPSHPFYPSSPIHFL
ncbi:hypothetical protein NMY22_g19319 [Coprinellus aureogranulatus]|nr:hypothetical protein NMY22_g19319 [Coprinellus aureogranulatus]